MNGPAVLIVLVGAGESSDPTTSAMDRATRAALEDATVEIREAHTPTPSDEEALAIEKSSHPAAMVELKWADASHRRATLRVHLSDEGRWVERTVAFKASDANTERGRTLGFAVASMLPDMDHRGRTAPPAAPSPAAPPTPPPPAPSQPPAPASASAPAPASASAPAPASAPASAPAPAPASAPAPAHPTPPSTSTPAPPPPSSTPPSPSPDSPRPPISIDLLALATQGVEAAPVTYGGSAALEYVPLPSLAAVALRLGAGFRAGDLRATVGSGNDSTLTIAPSAGLALHFVRPSAEHRLGASARLDWILVWQQVTHDSTTHVTKAQSGLDAWLDLEVQVLEGFHVLVGAGMEEVFSPTYVYFGEATNPATLPATRIAGEAGVKLTL